MHFGKIRVLSHLNQSFLHPNSVSSLLRRAASHMTVGETRQRPQRTNKIMKSQACEKNSRFHTERTCLILIFFYFGHPSTIQYVKTPSPPLSPSPPPPSPLLSSLSPPSHPRPSPSGASPETARKQPGPRGKEGGGGQNEREC